MDNHMSNEDLKQLLDVLYNQNRELKNELNILNQKVRTMEAEQIQKPELNDILNDALAKIEKIFADKEKNEQSFVSQFALTRKAKDALKYAYNHASEAVKVQTKSVMDKAETSFANVSNITREALLDAYIATDAATSAVKSAANSKSAASLSFLADTLNKVSAHLAKAGNNMRKAENKCAEEAYELQRMTEGVKQRNSPAAPVNVVLKAAKKYENACFSLARFFRSGKENYFGAVKSLHRTAKFISEKAQRMERKGQKYQKAKNMAEAAKKARKERRNERALEK